MSKKSIFTLVGFLVLGVVVTYGVAIADFVTNKSKNVLGLPFGFSDFNFLGTDTNQAMLFADIVFWAVILWIVWKIFLKLLGK